METSSGLLILFACMTKLSLAHFERGMCYIDRSGRNRVLPNAVLRDHSLTIEKCIAHCRSCNYDYAGVETGHECWCGNKEPADSQKRHWSECSSNCAGNRYQRCGGIWRINVYTTGLCYKDGSGHNRVLPHAIWRSSSLTIEKCIHHCYRRNFDFAGVQTGHECWCGNHNPNDSQRRPQSECSVRCAGNHNQKCGGIWRINVYKVGSSIRGNRNLQGYESKQIQGLEKQDEIDQSFEKEVEQNYGEDMEDGFDQMDHSLDQIEESLKEE